MCSLGLVRVRPAYRPNPVCCMPVAEQLSCMASCTHAHKSTHAHYSPRLAYVTLHAHTHARTHTEAHVRTTRPGSCTLCHMHTHTHTHTHTIWLCHVPRSSGLSSCASLRGSWCGSPSLLSTCSSWASRCTASPWRACWVTTGLLRWALVCSAQSSPCNTRSSLSTCCGRRHCLITARAWSDHCTGTVVALHGCSTGMV